MSKFFRGDSSDESSSDESGQEEPDNNSLKIVKAKKETQKFEYESSSSDDEKRTVRTEKDKRWEQLQNTIKSIKNFVKIGDWANTNKTLQELDKQLGKAKNITRKEGIPKFYFKIYLDVANSVSEAKAASKKDKKKTNRTQAKALNAHEQNHKKWLKQWKKELVAYNKNPLTDAEEQRLAAGGDESSDSESDSDSDDDGRVVKVQKPAAEEKVEKVESGDDEEEGDSEEWSQSDDDEDSGSEDEFGAFEEGGEAGPQFTRDFWVKKEFRKGYVDTSAQKKAKIAKAKEEREKKRKEEAEKAKNAEVADPAAKKVKPAEKKEVTPEEILKKLKDLHAGRGKRGTNQNQVKGEITMLIKECKTSALKLKCMTFLATTLIDMTMNKGNFMAAPVWKELAVCMKEIIAVLASDKKVQLAEDEQVKDAFEEDEEDMEGMTMEALLQTEEEKKKKEEEKVKKREEAEKARQEAGDAAGVQYVSGNLYSFILVLFNEFTKSLQNIDHKTPDYVARLKDELMLIELIKFAQDYYCSINKYLFSTRIVLFRLQLTYYRYDKERDFLVLNDRKKEELAAKLKERRGRALFNEPRPGPAEFLNTGDGSEVHGLAAYLYKHGSDYQKINALLCHIYYFALHNHYDAGRELLLMSHVQDSINDCDLKTRIMYNRAMAQMGLAAFRVGSIRDALYALADFYQPNRIKELLAQGLMPRRRDYNDMSDRDKKDQAKEVSLEKLRQIPYHMHINLDVLEAVHLLSAMLLEVPNVAQHGFDNKKSLSKAFRKFLQHHLKQAFNGPPENTRDSVMAASKAMLAGDWKSAWKHTSGLKVWSLVVNKELVMPTLLDNLKKETLKTYLLNYGPQYTMVKLQSLMEMFELSERAVYVLCSKMMVYDQLKGDWNQPLNSVVMRAEEPTHMQKTAVKYVEKIMHFLESNERLVDNRSFGYDLYPGRWNNNNNRKPFHAFRKGRSINQQRYEAKKKYSTRTWATSK